MVTRNGFILRGAIFWHLQAYNKYNQCDTTLGGLSSVCAKLEPASFKNIITRDKCPAEIYNACSFPRSILTLEMEVEKFAEI